MNAEQSARKEIFPSGNCIEGETAEIFEALDRGSANPAALAIAEQACQNCLQLEVCRDNQAVVGSMIFKGIGGLRAVIGGTTYQTDSDSVRERVLEPIIAFNMDTLPDEPGAALRSMRRAIRAGQFTTGPHTPKIVPVVAKEILHDIEGRNPELATRLQHPEHMGVQRVSRGFERMVQMLFLQADYPIYKQKRRSDLRFRPDRVGPQWSQIIELYAEDMMTLDQRRYNAPETQAMVFSPEQYLMLHEAYGGKGGFSRSEFNNQVVKALHDPESQLRAMLARLHVLREAYQGTNIPHSLLVQRARDKLPPGGEVPEITRRAAPTYTPVQTIKAIVAGQPVDAEHAHIATNVISVWENFGDDPFFMLPTTLVRFASLPAADAHRRFQGLHQKIQRVIAERADDDSVPLDFVKNHALMHGENTYGEIKEDYIVRTVVRRLKKRQKHHGLADHAPAEPWMVSRAFKLSEEPAEFEAATEGVYKLLITHSILTVGLAEMKELQVIGFEDSVAAIADPASGKYLAFQPHLKGLSTTERLALASYYDVGNIVYGQTFDKSIVAKVIGIDDLERYITATVLPKCQQLLNTPLPQGSLPIAMRQLSDDIQLFKDAHNSAHMIPNGPGHPTPKDIATVVGGQQINIGLESIRLDDSIASTAKRWLQTTIMQRCFPLHSLVADSVRQAFLYNIIQLTGDNPKNFKIRFAPHLTEAGDEQELAALSNFYGIDTFMYGADLTAILEERLETSIHTTAQRLIALVHDHTPPEAMHVDNPEWLQSYLSKQVFIDDTPSVKNALAMIRRELISGKLRIVSYGTGSRFDFSDNVLANNGSARLLDVTRRLGISGILTARSREAVRSTGLDNYERRLALQAAYIRAQEGFGILVKQDLAGVSAIQRQTTLAYLKSRFFYNTSDELSAPDSESTTAAILTFKAQLSLQFAEYSKIFSQQEGQGEGILRDFLANKEPDSRAMQAVYNKTVGHEPTNITKAYQAYLEILSDFASWLALSNRK